LSGSSDTGRITLQGLFRDWLSVDPLRGKRLATPPAELVAEVVDFPGVRLTAYQAGQALNAVADRLAPTRPLLGWDEFNILALSGGAAGGAFGAGALVGLSKAGKRPDFAIVTGVSTGALIAPLAFVGDAWDARLADAYVGGHASELLSLKAFAGGMGTGLFKAEGLEALIAPVIDDRLIQAVATEHARGRRLLIATTNLDSQKAAIWDMGAIATRGGPAALHLFRDVMLASASVPGLFPPKLFDVEAGGERYQEMHVDGGVAAPLFLMPDALLHWRRLSQRLRRGRVYVIVNTVLDPPPRSTPPGVASIMGRGFDAMLRFSYRQALSLAAGFCARHHLPLSIASIPPSFDGFNMLRFDTATMQHIFDAAVGLAATDTLWTSPAVETGGWRDFFKWPPSLQPAGPDLEEPEV
jgi:hypothetical protein